MPLDQLMRSDILAESSSLDTIEQIKAAAIREFEALDRRARIHSTEYFNHSYAPDIVLTWSDGSVRERYVYLRSTRFTESLSEDVDRLGDQHPIMLGLVDIPREVNHARSHLHDVAQGQNTLVTDATALASIEDAKRLRPSAGLLSSALMRGGRGLVGDDEARRVTTTVSAGLESIGGMSVDRVLRAAELLSAHLSQPFADTFGRVLQAVWIGSGERSDLFPLTQLSLFVGADDDTLEFLLNLNVIDDLRFWHRIGSAVSVEQLGRINVRQPNDNLQLLIKANLGRLKARIFRMRYGHPTFDDMNRPAFWWKIERGTLALRGPNWTAYIAEKIEDLGGLTGTGTRGVPLADLRTRSRAIPLVSLQLSDGHVAFDLNSLEQTDIIQSNQLEALESSLGSRVTVYRARALNKGRQVVCDFRNSSATVPTSTIHGVADLLWTAIPLLRSLNEEERAELEETLRPEGGDLESDPAPQRTTTVDQPRRHPSGSTLPWVLMGERADDFDDRV